VPDKISKDHKAIFHTMLGTVAFVNIVDIPQDLNLLSTKTGKKNVKKRVRKEIVIGN
jgi:hypothetical protein